MWNYVPSLATVILAVLQLAKDWGAHQTTWRRALVLILIILLGIGNAINVHRADVKSVAQHVADQKQISGFKSAVDTANTNQEANTKVFVKSFADLSQKLSKLETQVKTTDLRKETDQLKAELKATQKAMVVPQAELEASLGEVTDKLENLNVKEVSVLSGIDGTVVVTIRVVNKSDAQAKSGSVFIRLCVACEYSEEPQRFTKPVGAMSTDREMVFQALNSQTALAVPLKIKPPTSQHRFEIAVTARCQNCVVHPSELLHVDY